MDVKYASKGAGATELKAPLQEAFEAGFFEDKAQFDTALQVGQWWGMPFGGAGMWLIYVGCAAGVGLCSWAWCWWHRAGHRAQGHQATGRKSATACSSAWSSALPALPALQEEAGIDLKALGREVAREEADDGTILRVFHSQLSTADPALKVRLPSAGAAAAPAAACGMLWMQGQPATALLAVKFAHRWPRHPLQKLHARLQPLLFFFVDAASAIDQEDPGWHLLTAVETSPEGVKVLGFATTYRLYHYPESARLKLAQILVLPPHQGRGAGSLLLMGAQALADELDACDLAVSWRCRWPGWLGGWVVEGPCWVAVGSGRSEQQVADRERLTHAPTLPLPSAPSPSAV